MILKMTDISVHEDTLPCELCSLQFLILTIWVWGVGVLAGCWFASNAFDLLVAVIISRMLPTTLVPKPSNPSCLVELRYGGNHPGSFPRRSEL
jgi:hypothetical protein